MFSVIEDEAFQEPFVRSEIEFLKGCEGSIEILILLDIVLHLLSVSTPTIFRLPTSAYARQYLLGCHVTIGQGPAVFTV